MPLHRNNALKPLPTSDSLPTFPSNKPRNSKLSLKVLLNRGIHVAGTTVQGELEISVKDKALGLGEVGIEMSGTEELRNRDHTSTKRILYSRLLFQGSGLPPSNAVDPSSSPSQGGFYPALRGRTRFAFKFDLPKNLPSTANFGANGVVRYELRAFASSLFEGDVDLKSEKKDVLVVERWDDWRKGNWTTGCEKTAEQQVKGREGGLLSMKASIGNDETSGTLPRLFWWRDVDEGVEGKGQIEVRVRMKNTTKRHVAGLKVHLIRRLRLHRDPNRDGPAPPQISNTITSFDFHGTNYDVRAGSEREMLVSFQLPKEECWTGRKGTLFDLDCFVRVQAEGGFLDPKLCIEMPVYIAHPFSISTTAQRLIDSERQKYGLQQLEIAPSPSVPFLRSPKSTLDFAQSPSSPNSYPHPHQGFAQQQQLHAQTGGHHYANSSISASPRPYSSPSPQPHFAPSPSHSPYNMPTPQNGYVSFDPTLPDLTPSRFLGSLQDQQPGQVWVPPEATMNVPVGPPQPPSSHTGHSFAYQHTPIPPPSLVQPPLPPLDSHPSRQPSPNRPNIDLSHLQGFSQQDLRQVEANLSPIEPYSALSRAHQDYRTASPSPIYSRPPEPHRTASAPASYEPETAQAFSPPPCPSPAPSIHRHSSLPPPPSPSSHFRQQSPSSTPSCHPPSTFDGLEAIGEDSESQAGTAKSQALTASALAALRTGDDDDASSVQSVRVGNSPGRTSVQDLEELVAEEERRFNEGKMVTELDTSKTLPAPPVPTGKTSSTSSKPMRAQDIFAFGANPPTSPSPKLAAPTESGFAALQARLSRSTTPLQEPSPSSPSPSRSPSPSKLDLPKVGTSALRARSLSRASRQRDQDLEKALKEAEEDPAEVVKKALSKSSWSKQKSSEPAPPPNVSSAVFKAVTAMKSFERPRGREDSEESVGESTCKVTSKTLEDPPEVKEVQVFRREAPISSAPAQYKALRSIPKEEESARTISPPPSRPPSRPIFASSPSKRHTLPASPMPASTASFSLESPLEPSPSSPAKFTLTSGDTTAPAPVVKVNEKGRKVVDMTEFKDLKNDAVARVGNWLQTENVETKSKGGSPWSSIHKSSSKTDIARKRRTIDFARPAPPPPTSSVPSIQSKPSSTSATVPSSPQPLSRSVSTEPTIAQLLAAETRAALRLAESSRDAPSPVSKGLNGFLAAAKKDEEFDGPKYHRSSARGGKGGKVTNVASIWASREEQAERIPSPSPILGHKANKSLSSIDTAPLKPSTQPLSPVGNSANRRSLQVSPAQPFSSSGAPAKPFLNTTQGRSSNQISSRTPSTPSSRPAVVSENERVKPSGASKVKDLLARYQQQIA